MENDSTNFLTVSLCRVCLCAYVFDFKPIHHWIVPLLVLLLLQRTRCQAGFVNGNPSGSQSKIRSEAFVEEWVFKSDEPSDGQNTVEVPMHHNTDHSEYIPVTPRASKQFTSLPWEPAKPQDKACFFGNELRHHCLLHGNGPIATSFIHDNSVPFLNAWNCHFQMMKYCAVTEKFSPGEIGSPGTDQFTAWVKMREHEILVQHMVDIQKATVEFREASERKHATSSHKNSSCQHFATRSIVQRRLSIFNWNPGPRQSKVDAFEPQIAGRWHIITLQEASDYVDHELLTNRFHVTHYAGCAVLFNKDTFYPNVDVKSIYLHDTRRDFPDQVMEREQGWVLQGVLSRAIFRRPPVSRQKYFTVLSLHTSNIYSKKKGIAKKLILNLRAIMISQEVDLVADDFNGTAWRCRSKDNLSTIDEAFVDSILPAPRGPQNCGDLEASADFSNHLALNVFVKWISMVHSPSHERHLTWDQPIKAAIMRHGSTWISSIGRTSGPSTTTMISTFPLKNDLQITHTGLHPKRCIFEVMSDHSLSSKICDHSHMVFNRTAPIRSLGTTHSSSPSDLMTRLSQRVWRVLSMTNSFRDVFSFRFSCFIGYHTSPCANVSCLRKVQQYQAAEEARANAAKPQLRQAAKEVAERDTKARQPTRQWALAKTTRRGRLQTTCRMKCLWSRETEHTTSDDEIRRATSGVRQLEMTWQRLSSSRGVNFPTCHWFAQVHKHVRKRGRNDRRRTNRTQDERFAPDAILLGHRRANWWVRAKKPTVHQCPHSVKGHPRPTTSCTRHHQHDKIKVTVSRLCYQHGSLRPQIYEAPTDPWRQSWEEDCKQQNRLFTVRRRSTVGHRLWSALWERRHFATIPRVHMWCPREP